MYLPIKLPLIKPNSRFDAVLHKRTAFLSTYQRRNSIKEEIGLPTLDRIFQHNSTFGSLLVLF